MLERTATPGFDWSQTTFSPAEYRLLAMVAKVRAQEVQGGSHG
ncbi:MAG TPA: hypothetical protein VMT34_11790 [Aggregatilineales bacterium]|nr:hypothetical protein [Aggregatilineales bacterium]